MSKWTKFKDSFIAAVSYNPESLVLKIRFADSGKVYEYGDVLEHTYSDFMAATSKGEFYNSVIKAHHPCIKKPK